MEISTEICTSGNWHYSMIMQRTMGTLYIWDTRFWINYSNFVLIWGTSLMLKWGLLCSLGIYVAQQTTTIWRTALSDVCLRALGDHRLCSMTIFSALKRYQICQVTFFFKQIKRFLKTVTVLSVIIYFLLYFTLWLALLYECCWIIYTKITMKQIQYCSRVTASSYKRKQS